MTIGYDYTRFDIVEAHYWWYTDHHDGQASREYRRLCQCIRMGFRPGPMSNGPDSEAAKLIYGNLCHKHGCPSDCGTDTVEADKDATSLDDETYNGWANYETWNVTLWVGNTEALYRAVRRSESWTEAREKLRYFGYNKTQDGVSLDDPRLDHTELDQWLEGL